MEKCLNEKCPYHVKGGCDLFPGEQWKSCKRSGASPCGGAGAMPPSLARKSTRKH